MTLVDEKSGRMFEQHQDDWLDLDRGRPTIGALKAADEAALRSRRGHRFARTWSNGCVRPPA